MAIPDVLRSLLTAPGPSGYEKEAARVFADAAAGFAEVTTDVMGTTVARVAGTGDGPLLAVVGHIDEIGVLVSHIDDKGFLWFIGVGGWDPVILVGQRVEVMTRDGRIPGVVGKKPIHLMEPRRPQAGARAEGAAHRHRRKGRRRGQVDGADRRRRGDRRRARRDAERPPGVALDGQPAGRVRGVRGRAPGCGVGRRCLATSLLSRRCRRRSTFQGAGTTAFSLSPDVAIVVDVTFETGQPGIDAKTIGEAKFGSGPAIGRGSTLHPAVFDRLVEAAEAAEIPYTISPSARYTGTDADAIHLSRGGIATGVVSIPLRHMHSPVEMVQLDDVANVARLIAEFARRLEPGTVFTR